MLGCQYKEYCIPGTLEKNNGGKGGAVSVAPLFLYMIILYMIILYMINLYMIPLKKLVHDTGALRYPEILSKKKPPINFGGFYSPS